LESSRGKLQEYALKIKGDLHVIFKRLSKVKPMTPSYVPLEVTKLLSETFFFKMSRLRKNRVRRVVWDTLYIYIYIYLYFVCVCVNLLFSGRLKLNNNNNIKKY